MSVTMVNDWYFLTDANLNEAMAAIGEYMDYLKNSGTGPEQSL